MKKLLWIFCCGSVLAAPDISSIKPDLVLPDLTKGSPEEGKRVKQTHPDWRETEVYHVIYLPKDWRPNKLYPVIVEYAGNGPYRNRHSDISTGHPEGSKMGYGISGGEGFIWVCLPYLNNAGTANVTRWWGNAPKYDAGPTVAYCKKVVPWICRKYGGDPELVVLCGFSRGAIACNYIGLHDGAISALWRAFIPYSHYDGVNPRWGYPGADRAAALVRLKRLGNRPQFICHENSEGRLNLKVTRKYLENTGIKSKFTFRETGYRNHNDAWLLRPGPARTALRNWLAEIMAD
ncbi:MAG TPA: hypothetical protein DGP39_10035 [Verrucomicrobiales bacterium]|nr:hypothetical protein [Verrucomicrobiales bacterium]|tara:strand:+ start:227 stop:1099 length:873 start_codon:yes stop_codon:yes gene_type:complete